MFRVVQQEEEFLAAQIIGERIQQWTARLFLHIQRGRHALDDAIGIGQGSQFDKPDAIRELVHEISRCLEGETGLACTAGTEQGQKTGLRQQLSDACQLCFATDKSG